MGLHLHLISILHKQITSLFVVLDASYAVLKNPLLLLISLPSFSLAVVSSPSLQLCQAQHAECWILQHYYSAFFPLLLVPCVALDLSVTEMLLLLPSLFPSFSFYLIFFFFVCTVVLLAKMGVGDR